MTDSRSASEALEVLATGSPNARAAATALETLVVNGVHPSSRAAVIALEVLVVSVPALTVTLATATETDTALDVASLSHSVSLTAATETDAALEVGGITRYVLLDTATETDEAIDVAPGRVYSLATPGDDVSSTFELTGVFHARVLDTAVEIDEARDIPKIQYPVTVEELSLGSFLDPRWANVGRRPFVGWGRRHARVVLPRTQKGLILYKDGRVIQVRDWGAQGSYPDADDRIGGGTVWVGQSTSWQAQVLKAAGYTLVELPDDTVIIEEG